MRLREKDLRRDAPERRDVVEDVLDGRPSLAGADRDVVAAVRLEGALGEDLRERVRHSDAVAPVQARLGGRRRWRYEGRCSKPRQLSAPAPNEQLRAQGSTR